MADWADEKARVLFSECRTAEGHIEKEVARQMIADALRAVCAETTTRVVKRCAEIADKHGKPNGEVIGNKIRAEKWGEE